MFKSALLYLRKPKRIAIQIMVKEQLILAQICVPSLEWQKRYAENEHYGLYMRIADLGREIVHDVSKGKT